MNFAWLKRHALAIITIIAALVTAYLLWLYKDVIIGKVTSLWNSLFKEWSGKYVPIDNKENGGQCGTYTDAQGRTWWIHNGNVAEGTYYPQSSDGTFPMVTGTNFSSLDKLLAALDVYSSGILAEV